MHVQGSFRRKARGLWVLGHCLAVLLFLVFTAAIATAGTYIPNTFPPIKAGKPYAGITITVPTQAGWASFKPAVDLTPKFEEMTGIKVKYDMIPGSEIPSKQLLEVSQRTGAYDVVQQHAISFGAFFRYLQPMEDRIQEVWGSVDKFEDAFFPVVHGVKGRDGKHYYVPFHANVQIGYYRRALLEDAKEKAAFKAKYGYELAPPKTIKQVEDIATFFTRPAQNQYGLTANWGGGQGFGAFLHYYYAAGYEQLDQNLRPTFKSPKGREEAIRIARWMQEGVYRRKFVNPDSVNFQTGQVSDYFLSGASAMAFGWLSDYWVFMQNPENVKNVGPVGAFDFPSFTGSDKGGYASLWMMGIPKDAKHPDAAWEYIKWVLNRSPQVEMAAGQLPPLKQLAYETAVKPGGINPPVLYDAFKGARIMIQVPEMSQQPRTKGIDLYTALMANKLTPEQFVDEYAAEIERTLERAGYYKK